MQDITFWSTRWRTIQAFGKNPLVRGSDRIEAIVAVSAITITLLAAPTAGAIGTAVYDARSRTCAEQSQTRRSVSATVAATRRGVIATRPHMTTTVVEVRWRSEGIQHTDSFSTNGPVAVGDQIDIWLNDQGKRVTRSSFQSAGVDAACVGLLLCLIVVGMTAALFALVRWRLDVRRGADWEREIADLINRRSAD
ncbi:hypothetical protein BVC93_12870 [Mycobacterium sp. MS1601]|uniref:Rv1733c family protein n=1 Tax=Mycobacterium sp. MS1601 TaxID=1936029 RepID=UPI0009795FF4|nr:hypothetical protein [Mycobacterium sp. MS1601]AQA03169.1 hypothetical protein BVC93_12870 [Mycobacterium sp. MS1601]